VPVADVLAAGDDWFAVTGREVTYEVVLLGGKNDDERHARALAKLLAGRRCTVNLIPFNPVDESPWKRPARATIDAFRERRDAHLANLLAT
jgi:23S rRNA (adenine2503-C2)-methyltransferase